MLYDPTKFLLIAGPCSLESGKVCYTVAQELTKLRQKHSNIQIIFKGSFDKANRTSISGKRGPGIEDGLGLLKKVKEDFGFPVITDIHTAEQAKAVGEVCDVLQIPAFLCRQTDLLVAAAETGSVINVKKGQFLSPQEMEFVVEKLRDAKASEIWQTERGTFFGYQNLVVDMRSLVIMKQYKTPVIFDATHSVQLPGAGGGKSGGQREFVKPLAKAAVAAGANGLFIETHPDPENAISDGATQIPVNEFIALIEECMKHWNP